MEQVKRLRVPGGKLARRMEMERKDREADERARKRSIAKRARSVGKKGGKK